jgi:hypothetical protein
MGSTADTAATTSARYGRVRGILKGLDGNYYPGTWTTNV